MILLTLRLVVPTTKRGEVLHALRATLRWTEGEPGCLSCRLYRDAEDENAFSLVQEWASQADLDRHLRSPQYRKVLAVMETASQPPELKINAVANTRGMEVIAAARGEQGA